MGIQEDVFEDFLEELEKDADFPENIVEKLKKLWESNEISKEKILDALAGGIEDTSNNQNH